MVVIEKWLFWKSAKRVFIRKKLCASWTCTSIYYYNIWQFTESLWWLHFGLFLVSFFRVLKILKNFSDAPGIVARVTSDEEHQMSLTSILFYLLMSGLCAFFQGISAFSVISLISTVSYSVANATKERISHDHGSWKSQDLGFWWKRNSLGTSESFSEISR